MAPKNIVDVSVTLLSGARCLQLYAETLERISEGWAHLQVLIEYSREEKKINDEIRVCENDFSCG